MLRLILKDILIQKKTLLTAFIYGFFAIYVFGVKYYTNGGFVAGAVAIGYLFITYAVSYDDKNNCHIALNSLPVKRIEVVLAKYLSVVLFGCIGIFTMIIDGFLAELFGFAMPKNYVTINNVLMVFGVLLVMYSIYYPLYFRFGAVKMNIVNVFLFMTIIVLPKALGEFILNHENNPLIKEVLNFIRNSPKSVIQILSFAAVALISLISIGTSTRIYKSKDF